MRRRAQRSQASGAAGAPRAAARVADSAPALPRRWDRAAVLLLCAWAMVIGWTSLRLHPTPLYSVESDTIGEYIPAARELGHGVLDPAHFQTKGPGYPILLLAARALTGGDDYRAARALNVAASAAGGGAAYLLFRAFAGAEVALFVLAGLLLNPIYARLSIEAGTDLPTFALLMCATLLVIRGRRRWTLFASGLLAGAAAVTRTNSLFLAPAALAVLARRPRPAEAWGAYLAGMVLPLGAWWIAARHAGIALLGTGNVGNVAYEIYGRAMTAETFGATTGRRFHTFLDVVRYQPATFASRIAINLATRWFDDMRVLLPPWIAPFAVPGLVVGWWRRPGWPAMALHLGLGYATLATVFYLARFGLYLIPFYLSGVVLLVLRARWPWRARPRAPARGSVLGPALVAILIASSAWPAARDVRRGLATAPHETRVGGLILRDLAHPGDRVMARKPNVAYFARADYVPLPDPDVLDFPGLLRDARAARARFLFFSVAEKVSRPQFAMLAYPGVSLPGLKQVGYSGLDPQHTFALYEFESPPPADSTLADSVIAALRGISALQPALAWTHIQLGLHLSSRGRTREALDELAVAERLAPRDPTTARLQIEAWHRLGEYDREAEACERAIRIGSRSGVERAALGWVRIRQGRWKEAESALSSALDINPGNVEYRYGRAFARLHAGDSAGAPGDLAQVLRLQPDHLRARLLLADLWRRQGRRAEALEVLRPARATDALEARQLQALADSLRTGPGAPRR